MKQWSNIYNVFNSMKWLTHYAEWHRYVEGLPIRPVSMSLDPCDHCNLSCTFCNSKPVFGRTEYDRPFIDKVCAQLARWGTKASCIGGGGEPLMCKEIPYLIDGVLEAGSEIGIVTNGTFILKHIDAVAKARWIGVSVDSATPQTYEKIKGGNRDLYYRMLQGIENLSTFTVRPELEYKFLVTEHNYKEIFEACLLAKESGFDYIHVRPGFTPTYQPENTEFRYTPEIYHSCEEQIAHAHQVLEDDKFKVFAIAHKFGPHFTKTNDFKRCYAGLCSGYISANGTVGFCFCQRYNKKVELCHIDNADKEWGGERHKALVAAIDVKQCPACTFAPCNEIFENVIVNDKMGRNFM